MAEQHEQPCMWALVDPDAPKENRNFRFVGTGHPIKQADKMKFCGTIFIRGGGLVFHIFEYTNET